MKPVFALLTTLTLLFGLAACGQTGPQGDPIDSQTQQEGTSSALEISVVEPSISDQSTLPASALPESRQISLF